MKETHLMLDIETLGVQPDSIILQVAAVEFIVERTADGITHTINSHFDGYPDHIEEKAAGFTISQSTLDWWATQNQSVFRDIKSKGQNPREVWTAFAEYLGRVKPKHIWGHATFDPVMVQEHLTYYGLPKLPHKAVRDIRTLSYLSDIDLNSYDWGEKTHNALDDCYFQIKYCMDAMRKLAIAIPKP